MSQLIKFEAVKPACAACSLSEFCVSQGVNKDELAQLNGIVPHQRKLNKGEHLYRPGQPFQSLYVVCEGSVKAFRANRDGHEQVVGFYQPGELLGFDAICDNLHSFTAVALENSSVCELPYQHLQASCKSIPGLRKHLITLISNETVKKHEVILMLGKKSAEVRIATFLLDISSRFHSRGLSAYKFNLSMSRHDIGNYLGLAMETVSRFLSQLQKQRIIEIDHRIIRIHDMNRLCELAEAGEPICPGVKAKQLGNEGK
jgi:CRP/FNR family transcriptional regulator